MAITAALMESIRIMIEQQRLLNMSLKYTIDEKLKKMMGRLL